MPEVSFHPLWTESTALRKYNIMRHIFLSLLSLLSIMGLNAQDMTLRADYIFSGETFMINSFIANGERHLEGMK